MVRLLRYIGLPRVADGHGAVLAVGGAELDGGDDDLLVEDAGQVGLP
jgi:hypothetical protein